MGYTNGYLSSVTESPYQALFTYNPGSTQNLNRYSYVLNNPLRYVDPLGYRYTKRVSASGEDECWISGFTYPGGGWGSNSCNEYGGAGFGENGTGLDGMYYDWYSGTYKYISEGNFGTNWESVEFSVSTKYEVNVVLIFVGSRENPYEDLKEIRYSDPSSQGGNIYNVENYGGIKGLNVSYYKDDRSPGQAVIELNYTADENKGAKWKQWCKVTNFSDMSSYSHWDGDNEPYYYTDTDMAKHTNGNTVNFYDNPYRGSPGSYNFTLTLYQPQVGNLLQINWGLTRYSNGNTILFPLTVKKF